MTLECGCVVMNARLDPPCPRHADNQPLREVIAIVGQIRTLGEMKNPPPLPGSLFDKLYAAYDVMLEATP